MFTDSFDDAGLLRRLLERTRWQVQVEGGELVGDLTLHVSYDEVFLNKKQTIVNKLIDASKLIKVWHLQLVVPCRSCYLRYV